MESRLRNVAGKSIKIKNNRKGKMSLWVICRPGPLFFGGYWKGWVSEISEAELFDYREDAEAALIIDRDANSEGFNEAEVRECENSDF